MKKFFLLLMMALTFAQSIRADDMDDLTKMLAEIETLTRQMDELMEQVKEAEDLIKQLEAATLPNSAEPVAAASNFVTWLDTKCANAADGKINVMSFRHTSSNDSCNNIEGSFEVSCKGKKYVSTDEAVDLQNLKDYYAKFVPTFECMPRNDDYLQSHYAIAGYAGIPKTTLQMASCNGYIADLAKNFTLNNYDDAVVMCEFVGKAREAKTAACDRSLLNTKGSLFASVMREKYDDVVKYCEAAGREKEMQIAVCKLVDITDPRFGDMALRMMKAEEKAEALKYCTADVDATKNNLLRGLPAAAANAQLEPGNKHSVADAVAYIKTTLNLSDVADVTCTFNKADYDCVITNKATKKTMECTTIVRLSEDQKSYVIGGLDEDCTRDNYDHSTSPDSLDGIDISNVSACDEWNKKFADIKARNQFALDRCMDMANEKIDMAWISGCQSIVTKASDNPAVRSFADITANFNSVVPICAQLIATRAAEDNAEIPCTDGATQTITNSNSSGGATVQSATIQQKCVDGKWVDQETVAAAPVDYSTKFPNEAAARQAILNNVEFKVRS